MTAESLSDIAKAIHALIAQAKTLCPERIPAPDAVLDDPTVLNLLIEVVRASRFAEYCSRLQQAGMELSIPESYFWLLDAIHNRLPEEKWLEALNESIIEIGWEIFTELTVYANVFDYDELDFCIDNQFLPFSLAIHAAHYVGDIDLDDLMQCDFGFEHSGAGVLGAAISPFLALEYREEIYAWESETETIAGLDRFPLLAFLQDDHGLPGVRHELLTGQMNKNQGVESVPWCLVPELFRELDVMDKASTVCNQHLPISPNWLAVQILNTFKMKSFEEQA